MWPLVEMGHCTHTTTLEAEGTEDGLASRDTSEVELTEFGDQLDVREDGPH